MDARAIEENRLTGRYETEGPQRAVQCSCRCAAYSEFSGPARCIDSKELCLETATRGNYEEGEAFVAQNKGPIAGQGTQMPVTATVSFRQEMGGTAALITGGRVSGAPRGFGLGRVGAAAAAGGPIRLVEDGNVIPIDAVEGILELLVSEGRLETRRKDWRTPDNCFANGDAWKYAWAVGAARKSTVTHPGGQAEVVCYADV